MRICLWLIGGFVYGSLIVKEDRYFICVSTIGVKMNCCINNSTVSMIEVIPSTIGQYTGSKDKNGNKIFEDDILKYINDDNEIVYLTVVFEKCAFLIDERGITEDDLLPTYECLEIELAGNIHDNPELLKEAKQE